jgi:hypothetical protein
MRRGCAATGFCIESSMRVLSKMMVIFPAVLAFSVALVAGLPGSFRGTIVEVPGSPSGKSWIYVQGRNGTARRVDISEASVTYDEGVPAAERRGNPAGTLTPGTEVRVTAEQGSDGEWKASKIEILQTAVKSERSAVSQHPV